jgi:hypothetical protein
MSDLIFNLVDVDVFLPVGQMPVERTPVCFRSMRCCCCC